MTTARPVYCARGGDHPATHHVTGRGRAEVVCDRHLDASLRWAGPGATAELLPGHDPPPQQAALF